MIGIDITSTQNQYKSRGIGNFTSSIIQECLTHIPNDIVLLGFDALDPAWTSLQHSLLGLPSKSTPLTRTYYERSLLTCIQNYNKKNPQNPITHYFSPFIHSGIPLLTDIKLYVFIHDVIQLHLNNYSEKGYLVNSIKSWLYHQDWRRLNSCELIFTNSQTSKRDMLEYLLIKRPIHVSYLGIDHGLYHEYDAKERVVLEDKEAHEGALLHPYILYFGGDERNKNVPLIVDSFLSYIEKNKDETLHLYLLGKGFDRTRAYIATLQLSDSLKKRIVYLGFKDDEQKIWYIIHALAFIHLSEFEGFGLSVLEAIACGTPCILTDIPVYQELFSNCASFVTLHDRIDSIMNTVHIIEQIVDQDKGIDEKRKNGLEQVKKFSWDKVFHEIFSNIAL